MASVRSGGVPGRIILVPLLCAMVIASMASPASAQFTQSGFSSWWTYNNYTACRNVSGDTDAVVGTWGDQRVDSGNNVCSGSPVSASQSSNIVLKKYSLQNGALTWHTCNTGSTARTTSTLSAAYTFQGSCTGGYNGSYIGCTSGEAFISGAYNNNYGGYPLCLQFNHP